MNDRQLKVLYIIDGLHGGGKERQLVELIKIFTKNNDVSVDVITFNKNKHYSETVKGLVPDIVELRKRPLRIEPVFTIWKHILKFKPDIIHTWDPLSSFYSWLPSRVFKIKLIDGSIRDAGIEKGWEYYFKRFFLNQADFVVANSSAGLKAYKVNGQVIYNAINRERFRRNEITKEFNIIMTANFTDYKDHKTFLKSAVKLIRLKVVDNAYLVGDGPHRKNFMNYIKENYGELSEIIRFVGAAHNVEEYLAECKIGILCSTKKYSEGVSNSILEYMAAGLVAIGTNVGGIPEIIEHGKNGFLINEGDSNAIVNYVQMVKEKPALYYAIRQSAFVTLEDKFNYNNNCEQLLQLYRSL